MEVNEKRMKTPYETMFLLPPAIGEEQTDQLLERLKESLAKKNGEFSRVEKMGVRKTAYTVNRMNSANYVLIQYRGNGETIDEVERILKNSDEVIKFLSTKITDKKIIGLGSGVEKKAAANSESSPPPAEITAVKSPADTAASETETAVSANEIKE
jgi:small subunit ribosomal protein S6